MSKGAWQEGFDAFHAGRDVNDNPHDKVQGSMAERSKSDHDNWRGGFRAAEQREIRSNHSLEQSK